jgi:hypothetical protein
MSGDQNGLAGITDTATQRAAVRSVSRREDLYSGPYATHAPDLLVIFIPGFGFPGRARWGDLPIV